MHFRYFGRARVRRINVTFFIERFLSHIVYTNVIVALSAGLLTLGYCHLAEIDNAFHYSLLTCLATFGVYNGQRLFKAEMQQTPWLSWVSKNRIPLTVLVLISLLVAGYILIFAIGITDVVGYALLGFVGLISAFYVIRIGGRNLREVPMLKIHLIAFSWTAMIVLFPSLNEGVLLNELEDSIAIYLLILGGTIPFDIRDLKYDNIRQKTIPQLVGVNAAISVATVCVLLAYGWLYYTYNEFSDVWVTLSFVLLVGLISSTNKYASDIYCAGWIDGCLGLIGLFLFLH